MKISKEVLKKIRLIVFDLDGTLVNDNGEIPIESIELINELRNIGVNFSFASGRQHSAITPLADKLGITTPLISLDGTLIKSFPGNKIIHNSFVPERYVKKAILLADRFLLKIALCHDEYVYYTDQNALIPTLLDKLGARYEEIKGYSGYTDRVLEIVITGDYGESIKHVESKMNFPSSFGLSTAYYKSQRHKGIYYLEIRKHGASKGKALKRLAKYKGLKMNEIAVMGDWYNDRTMFETKAVKVAIQNAVPEIKRMADLITNKDNNNGGVAEFLEMVLKSKR